MRRGLATAGAAALGLGMVAVAATPGHAEDPYVDLSVEAFSATASLDSTEKSVRIAVGNNSSADVTATNVRLEFKLPEANEAGSIRVSDELAPSCELSEDGRGGSCAIGDLEVGARTNINAFTLLPTGNGGAGDVLGWITVAVEADQPDRDANESQNDNSVEILAQISSERGPDLATWVKRDLVVLPGETGRLDDSFLKFSNESDIAIQGISFNVVVPTELSFTNVPAGCEIDGGNSFIVDCIWDDLTIPANGEVALSGDRALTFKVSDTAPENTVLDGIGWVAAKVLGAEVLSITSSRPAESGMTAFFADEVESGDTADDNWSQFSVFTHGDRADLSLTGNELVAPINNTTELHLTVTNHGPAPARSHSVEAYVPAYAQLGDLPEACYLKGADATRIQCDSAGLLDPGASVIYTIPVTMVEVPAESDRGRAQVTSSQPDPDFLNNFDIFEVTSIENRADLALSVGEVSGYPGDEVEAVFTVTNNGPAAAANHQVLVTVPTHAEVGELPATCMPVGTGTLWCAVGTALNAGDSATLTIPLTIVDAPQDQELGMATVSTQSAPDPDDSNNTVSYLVSATENRADLSIAASELDGKIDEQVSGTITVTNNGPGTVAVYMVLFTLPLHSELVEVPAGCEAVADDQSAVLCAVAEPLDAGASRDITYTVTLVDAPEEQLPGSAAVLSTQPDPDETNNSVQFTVHAETEPGPPGEPGDPGDDDGANGKLPTTGVSLSTALIGAALLAALGVAALLVTKRRRSARTYGGL
ncbi:LPXTG cell wall anchor domain-containing protein [Stackebrandtia endophytica]|nr:LPXTG cell wall anchor domain-containing protein [Stackebrandtia endophytica]